VLLFAATMIEPAVQERVIEALQARGLTVSRALPGDLDRADASIQQGRTDRRVRRGRTRAQYQWNRPSGATTSIVCYRPSPGEGRP
jgi:hypothetical protein